MKFIEMLIHRPVVSIVLSLILVVLGFFAYRNLGVRQYPNIVQPVVTIQTTYIGANPELIERQITSPIEDQLSGVDGMRYYTSTSRKNQSMIRVTFKLSANLDSAAAEVRSRVQAARDNFPADAQPPIVKKASGGGQAIMYLALSSKKWSVPRLSEYFELAIKSRLESLQGVQEVQSFGTKYGMRLWINPQQLAARGMTPLDVLKAVNTSNIDLPGGGLINRYKQYQVQTNSSLNTQAAFNNMVIAYRNGYPIRLEDVGHAQLSGQYVPPQHSFAVNGVTTLGMGVKIFANADSLAVASEIRKALPQIRGNLPADLSYSIMYDRTRFIHDSINEVILTIGIAVVLVVIVVSLFLLSFRAITIPLVTIPLSLAGAMAIIYGLGFSLNLLTLLALVLAIGLVVDDGIVVLENTSRHIEEGEPAIPAAVNSMREIAFPVLATASTLAIVYFPIGLQSGQVGKLFRQFAFTLAGTVLVSGYIALTLSPMMCSRILKKPDKPKEEEGWMQRWYERFLRFVLDHLRPLVIVLALAVGAGAYFLYGSLPSKLLPVEDQDVVMVFFKAPDGSNYHYMKTYGDKIEAILRKQVPERERTLLILGNPTPSQGLAIIVLKPASQRKRSQQQIVKALFSPMGKLSGVQAVPLNPPPPSVGGQSNQKVNFVMTTLGSYKDLQKATSQLLNDPKTKQYITHAQPDLDLHVMNFEVSIDRSAAAAVHVSANDVAQTLAASLAPYRSTRIKRNGKTYDVFIQMQPSDRRNPDVLKRIYVRNGETGALVPISTLVDVKQHVGPIYLGHYLGLRAVTIDAGAAGGSSLGEALKYLRQYAQKHFDNVTPQFTGYSDTFIQSQGQFVYLFGAAVLVVYLVLAAMFNSFLDPLIILLTVPLSLFGAVVLLKITGGTLNLYSNIGLVTLVGLITKNGILIVDFANQLRHEGMDVEEAIIQGSKLRLRPILMTTAAMVFGAAPLAVAWGAGAEARHPLGWIIIGGLTFGTLLTLVVIPTVYSYLTVFESAEEEEEPPQPPTGGPHDQNQEESASPQREEEEQPTAMA